MSREVHVRFREGLGVRFPRATRLQIRHWPKDQVMEVLGEVGFVDREELTRHFEGAGSCYYRFKKPDPERSR